jgi:hypothetical protein
MHAILPINYKGKSKWDYSWVPIVAPIIGGLIAGLLAHKVGIPGSEQSPVPPDLSSLLNRG